MSYVKDTNNQTCVHLVAFHGDDFGDGGAAGALNGGTSKRGQ